MGYSYGLGESVRLACILAAFVRICIEDLKMSTFQDFRFKISVRIWVIFNLRST